MGDEPTTGAERGRLSRLRLGLALWFGVAFLLALVSLDLGLLFWLDARGSERLTASLDASAPAIAENIEREASDERLPLREAAAEVVGEWPADLSVILILDEDRAVVLSRLPAGIEWAEGVRSSPSGRRPWEWEVPGEEPFRMVSAAGELEGRPFQVVVGASTAPLRALEQSLAQWMAVSTPLALLGALVVGYLLAARSLRALRVMSGAIHAMEPDDLAGRLPEKAPPDEIDVLAGQFNGLLDRLEHSRQRNQRFIARAAHQIRTPLTVARGEAGLALEGKRSPEELRASLARILAATELMSRRVGDLLLLAEAESAGRPDVGEPVEIDGLALECTDLMRGRATRTRHPLELGRVDAIEVRGNEYLLREALVELIENALRHSDQGSTVRVSAWLEGAGAALEVASRGRSPGPGGESEGQPAVEDGAEAGTLPRLEGDRAGGLGLEIVRWIARVHEGRLVHENVDGENRYGLHWPATPPK